MLFNGKKVFAGTLAATLVLSGGTAMAAKPNSNNMQQTGNVQQVQSVQQNKNTQQAQNVQQNNKQNVNGGIIIKTSEVVSVPEASSTPSVNQKDKTNGKGQKGMNGTENTAPVENGNIQKSNGDKQFGDRGQIDKETQDELATQVTVTEEEAIASAQTSNADYTFTFEKYVKKGDVVYYVLTGTNASEETIKVLVNGTDGTVTENKKPNGDKQFGDRGQIDKETQDELATQVTVTEEEAIASAQTSNADYTFTFEKYVKKDDVVYYVLTGTNASEETIKVLVNGTDGTVTENKKPNGDKQNNIGQKPSMPTATPETSTTVTEV